uniref:Ima1 N-terminal domain-containing protein n=1 Tax=Panagrolaimus sp. PS1159 TaxID=55785 RepID=A0AC35GDI5_9BILA
MINTILVGIVAVSAVFYLYTVLRPKIKTRVNCWFCNVNQWIPYPQRNSFTCKKCDQYNGFDENGDYNKFIASQRVESLNIGKPTAKKSQFTPFPTTNGLCEGCNQMQAVIIERLNKFEAIDERQYFEEYERYKRNLNLKYPLCNQCQKFTDEKLQFINNKYLTPAKTTSNPFATRNAPTSRTPSVFSESAARSVYSEPRGRTPSLYSMPNSKPPSTFQRNRAPSLFSEPVGTPSFIRTSKAPSVSSGFSFKTIPTHRPQIFDEESKDEEMDYSMQKSKHGERDFSIQKPKHDHENRKRKFYFASGKATIACNILTFFISIFLFIFYFDSIWSLGLERYISKDTVTALRLCKDYGALTAITVFGIFCYGLDKSLTRINLLDLMTVVSWPLLFLFCIFDVERNPDFLMIQMMFSGYLFMLSVLTIFIPKKRKHRKRPNTFYSAFSVASTPVSQCSSRLTASRIHNMSNLSQHSKSDSVPDLVEDWVRKSTPEAQTVTKLHDLHI